MNNHANQTSDTLMKLKIGGNVKIGPYSREPRFARPHSSLGGIGVIYKRFGKCMGTLGCHNASYIILLIEDAICLKSRFFVKIYNIFNKKFQILKKLTYY